MPGPSYLPTLLAIADTVRVSAPTLVESTLGRVDRAVCDRRLASWGRHGVAITGMALTVEGQAHVDPRASYVVMSNHQSNWDIIALYRAFPGETLRMVAKEEMKRIPILGPAMEGAEFIFVDRKNPERARAAIELARQRLESGVSVWIAPEGTRSRDGVLGPFKKGGFHLAFATGAPILPCTIDGTRHVTPPGELRVKRGVPVQVRFHAPIDPRAYGPERRADLIDHVRDVIASGLPPDRR